jgi:hypothetical protein
MLAHKNRALRIVQHITGEACIRRHHHIWIKSDGAVVEFARCFLRLATLPNFVNFALDRLSRYEAGCGAGGARRAQHFKRRVAL